MQEASLSSHILAVVLKNHANLTKISDYIF